MSPFPRNEEQTNECGLNAPTKFLRIAKKYAWKHRSFGLKFSLNQRILLRRLPVFFSLTSRETVNALYLYFTCASKQTTIIYFLYQKVFQKNYAQKQLAMAECKFIIFVNFNLHVFYVCRLFLPIILVVEQIRLDFFLYI